MREEKGGAEGLVAMVSEEEQHIFKQVEEAVVVSVGVEMTLGSTFWRCECPGAHAL